MFKTPLLRASSASNDLVLCVDADDPGCDLREALAYVLGKARVSFVNWPEGCKDANEMLLANGPGALHDLVEYGAVPWPVSIYRMSGIPEPGPIKHGIQVFRNGRAASGSLRACCLSLPDILDMGELIFHAIVVSGGEGL